MPKSKKGSSKKGSRPTASGGAQQTPWEDESDNSFEEFWQKCHDAALWSLGKVGLTKLFLCPRCLKIGHQLRECQFKAETRCSIVGNARKDTEMILLLLENVIQGRIGGRQVCLTYLSDQYFCWEAMICPRCLRRFS
jgi:hypothetical protein